MSRIKDLYFSCHKSPYDSRDILIKTFIKEEEPPLKYDLTNKMTPVRSQGKEGSCVGFAVATGVKEYQEKIDYKRFVNLSPRYVYEIAKGISGHKEGTTLRAAMQVIHELGVCEENLWPYVPNETNSPSPKAEENAKRYKVKTYARITNLGELKQAIVQFGATIIGIRVYKSIYKTKSDGIVPTPNMAWPSNWRSIGGHAVCVAGYDDEKKLVKFKNSWGANWGLLGYGFLSYEYVRQQMLDAFSCLDIDDPEPYRIKHMPYTEKENLWI